MNNMENKNIILLSASQLDNLKEQVYHFKIDKYFTKILGLDNILAKSKIEVAEKYFKENNIDLSKTIILGDTIHDAEVANKLKIDSILIADGHQSYDRLKKYKKEVIRNIKELEL